MIAVVVDIIVFIRAAVAVVPEYRLITRVKAVILLCWKTSTVFVLVFIPVARKRQGQGLL